jgi:ion channel-forming bestrophin family protein
MKVYNTKNWVQFIFLIQKSDTLVRLAPLILVILLYSLGIAYLELEYFKFGENSWVKNLPVMHSLLSFVISMLLVFRTNTAYDRWWEGRKLWGNLVNSSRNFALKLAAILDPKDEINRRFFRKTIPMYGFVLKDHLQSKSTEYMLDDENQFFEDLPSALSKQNHVPNQVAKLMFARLNELYKNGKISGDQLIVLNGEITSFTDICGACERIKNTPIPYSYSSFIRKFILFYSITLPIGYSLIMGYYAAPIVAFIFYVLASLELIAEEIEEPFGTDQNDLPMEKIAENIDKHVGEIL